MSVVAVTVARMGLHMNQNFIVKVSSLFLFQDFSFFFSSLSIE